MPDLWDTNSDHVFPTPGEQSDSALSGHGDHSQEVRLRDHRGRLRLPAYIVIALVLAVAAIVVLTAVLLPQRRHAVGLPIQAEGARPCDRGRDG